jgi:adenosylhomocysteine nucleosidase
LAVSAGFACALAPAAIGDLLIGTAVVPVGRLSGWTVQGEWAGCDQDAQSRVTTAARRAGVAARSGYLVSASTVVWLADDKRELSRQTGAAGFDMESVAIGSVAVRKGIPFAIVRTISDLVDEDLPLDFNLFLQPGGWVSGLRALFSCPSGLIALNRLRRQSRVASGQLAKVFRQWAADGFRACTGEG